MIDASRSKSRWQIGNIVKVGFLTLKVVDFKRTPEDYKPDAYLLTRNDKFYVFVPHHGLESIDCIEEFNNY